MTGITQKEVRRLFSYRKDGVLIRLVQTNPRALSGDIAGSVCKRGYFQFQIEGKKYYTHRIVWLWHHGYLPENEIDHINQNKLDNRIENLREVSRSCNRRNTRTSRRNLSSGIKGVTWCKFTKKWRAIISVRGKQINLGCHHDLLEAVCHRLAAEQAEGWEICDSCSPAFKYIKAHINHVGIMP